MDKARKVKRGSNVPSYTNNVRHKHIHNLRAGKLR